nr:PIN-like domain-containing protein [Agrobacterium sp. rho-8.1]
MEVNKLKSVRLQKKAASTTRQWSGPLIGAEPETADDYLKRVKDSLSEGDTHAYFDTSFLMWLAKAGKPSRSVFFDWLRAQREERFHVPLWSAHEFFKHRLKKTVTKEVSADIKAFDDAAVKLYEKMRLYCSDDLFGFANSGALFLDEYTRTVQPLRSMLQLAQKSEQFEHGIQAVSAFIDSRLLSGPLDEVIADVDFDERVRNRGVIPPSFKDAHKRGSRKSEQEGDEENAAGDNSFGDLIFWRETLRHATSVKAGGVIILTADRKNDWFLNHHGEQGVTKTVHRLVQKPRPVPAPHPLLRREAFDKGIEELILLDPMYCGVLLEGAGVAYKSFAQAALDTQLPKLSGKPAAARSWATRFGALSSLIGKGGGGSEDQQDQEADDSEDDGDKPVELGALHIDNLSPAAGKLSKAASTYLGAINKANSVKKAELFAETTWASLETWSALDLITFGRRTERLAEAGDLQALYFLTRLRDEAIEMSEFVRESLYFGSLGALYYDDNLAPKTAAPFSVSPVLLDLVTMPEVANAVSALGEALAGSGLFFTPGSSQQPLVLEVVVQPAADNKSNSDLQAIKLGGVDLMTTLQDEEAHRFSKVLQQPGGAFDTTIGSLIDILARYHRLPRQLITANMDTDQQVRVSEYSGVELEAMSGEE